MSSTIPIPRTYFIDRWMVESYTYIIGQKDKIIQSAILHTILSEIIFIQAL
ncbi:MAG: hypothetical protein IPP29_23490 [Bacteroidetes bacterium]|nr:hypothetical protein [Bacteroidota bacterium]